MIDGLSGGERKRTSIGCELLNESSLIILDEPTSGLDSQAALNIMQYLKKLTKLNQTTVICSIH
jgi:ABC-type multidrug transport system ATPase subunit